MLIRFAPTLLALTLAVTMAPAAEPTLTVDLGGGVSMELILIRKGTFTQGSPADEPGRGADETRRQVTLTRDFYMGKFPVTRGQFARFLRATNYRTEAEVGSSGGFGWGGTSLVQRKEFTWRNPGFVQEDDHPVTLVTYKDARSFLDWLARQGHGSFELPTEAQWEYACRAGTITPYYNGRTEQDARAIAWFKVNAGKGTMPVGRKKANAFGLYDMSGNVFEWCRDWYGPYAPGPVTDPEDTRTDRSDQPRRVLRGGSWLREASHCRSAARYRNTPGSRNADNGFRVVLLVTEQPNQAMPEAGGPGRAGAAVPLAQPGEPIGGQAGPIAESVPAPRMFLTALLCFAVPCGLVFLVAILIVVLLSRRRKFEDRSPVRTPGRRPTPAAIRPRLVDDGFWLDAPHLIPGSVVRYRYRAGGRVQTDQFTVAPGPRGQFVYTGVAPLDVEVLEILPPGSAPLPLEEEPPYRPPAAQPPPRPFTGYPSAY
jgi:formylglycine-generating enzyme required for sulfatase activity